MGDADALGLPTFAERTSLRERVADALLTAIVSGEMAPGEVYSVPTLASRFGISPTPVREAMLDLAKDGLVEPVRNKGFRVVVISGDELDQITEIRSLLEPPAVATATRLATPPDLAALRPLARATVEAASARDPLAYLDADREFHLRLLSLSGNARLASLGAELRAQTQLFGLAPLAERGGLVPWADEHVELLDIMATGDADRAAALTARHIGHVRGIWAGRAGA